MSAILQVDIFEQKKLRGHKRSYPLLEVILNLAETPGKTTPPGMKKIGSFCGMSILNWTCSTCVTTCSAPIRISDLQSSCSLGLRGSKFFRGFLMQIQSYTYHLSLTDKSLELHKCCSVLTREYVETRILELLERRQSSKIICFETEMTLLLIFEQISQCSHPMLHTAQCGNFERF